MPEPLDVGQYPLNNYYNWILDASKLRERAGKLWKRGTSDRQPRITTYVVDEVSGRLGFGFEGPGRGPEGGVNGAGRRDRP